MVKRMRAVRPLAMAYKEAIESTTRPTAFAALEKAEPAIASGLEYQPYTVEHHVKLLELGPEFTEANNGLKILELGSGTGRLAAHLVRKMPSVRYTLFDAKYSNNKFPLNRSLRRLAARGKVRILNGDFHRYRFRRRFRREKWHHILIPASFFPRSESRKIEEIEKDRIKLLKKLLKHVEKGGTIRLSHIGALQTNFQTKVDGQVGAFLEEQRRRGRLNFKVTEAETPKHVARWTTDKIVHGLVITLLK